MNNLLINMDPKTWYILAGLCAILLIISIIKKAIKLGVVILITIIMFLMTGPQAKDIHKSYNIQIDSDTITVTLDGQQTLIEREGLSDITMMRKEERGDNYLIFAYKNGHTKEIQLPDMMEKVAEITLKQLGYAPKE